MNEFDVFSLVQYDNLIRGIYRAGAGLAPWLEPLEQMVAIFGGWAVQLLGVDKRSGTMTFSYEAGSGSAEAAIDYLRTYNRVDPRFELQRPWPVGKWLACQEHFDDAYVATSPFYQDFLIPHGGRYLFGAKLHEDDASVVVIGHLTRHGEPPLDTQRRLAFQEVSDHIGEALRIQRHLNRVIERDALGFALLDRLRQPVIMLDIDRRITFRSDAAQAILTRGDVIYDHEGVLVCRHGESDIELTLAMRELALVPFNSTEAGKPPLDRRSIRLRRTRSAQIVAGTLLALRPRDVMGAFGSAPQALLTIYEPGASKDIDPFLLSTTFDLTPAEARVAAHLASGFPLDEIAHKLNVSITTVRSQLRAVFDKTGTNRQADLVRLLLAASAF
jgi:DNA-binding CsgD family transcriptional regulator/PAS domain-containing protein